MIKFFRKFRLRLLTENKFSKYFLYALGEIILVVIGILIALQINNWNEQRKFKNLEISMLSEIRSDLQESLEEINNMIQTNGKHVEDYKALLNYINNKLPYDKSLDTYFGRLGYWASPYFNYSAFETLKNIGANLISNDSLKERIIKIYDKDFTYLVSDYDKSEWNYSSSVVNPFFSKHFERDMITREAFPNNYNEVMNNVEFKNILTSLMSLRYWGILRSQKIKTTLENLIKDISKEIDTLDKV